MDDDDEQECVCPAGLPAYLATFADLMSLLMCFFVLLLAFSEMDAQKYKQVAGSMKMAFGVQAQVRAKDTPKGTSIIAQEFSPGRPNPTILNVVQQETIDNLKNTLEVLCQEGPADPDESSTDESVSKEAAAELMKKLIAQTQAAAVHVAEELKQDIQEGKIDVETIGRKIIIRVKENGSFPSGSATLQENFIPIMDKIRGAIMEISGDYSVAGHTDDVPIATLRFRSNWELSSARAVSVAHELMKTKELAPERFVVVGHGETKPRVENDSDENRAQNRRVEIIVEQGNNDEAIIKGEKPLPEDEEFNLDMLKAAGLEDLEGFRIIIDGEFADEEDREAAQAERVISVLETPTPAATPLPSITPSPTSTVSPAASGNGSVTPSVDDFETLVIETEPRPTLLPTPLPTSARSPTPPATGPGNGAFDLTDDPFAPRRPAPQDEFF
jgi:chemotaxis protein MotB